MVLPIVADNSAYQTVMSEPDNATDPRHSRRPLTSAARRALAEAEARRREIDAAQAAMPAEKGGRGGLDPVRYGDWEIKGLTADF
jgi:hypothetical protein